MDTTDGHGSQRIAGKAASPGERARLKRDLDDFVDLMSWRVLDGAASARTGPIAPTRGSNDN